MPPCAFTNAPGGSSAQSASIAAGVAPSGPRPGGADDAVAAGRDREASGEPPRGGLEVAGLDHGAHGDLAPLRARRSPAAATARASSSRAAG